MLWRSRPQNQRPMKIVNALATNLVDSRQLEGWAGISPRTTYRRFVTESGLTFAQSRQQARLLRALERIADVAPVTTIALDLGYDNASAFIDMVRRALGMTPGGYGGGFAPRRMGMPHQLAETASRYRFVNTSRPPSSRPRRPSP